MFWMSFKWKKDKKDISTTPGYDLITDKKYQIYFFVSAKSFFLTWYFTGAAGFSRRMVRATSVPERCIVAIWKLT